MPAAVESVEMSSTYSVRINEGKGIFGGGHTSRPIYLGIIFATLSSLFFSLCSVIVKSLTDINPIELAMFRFVGLLAAIPILVYKEEPVFPKGKRILLLLRCFVGCTGLVLSFYSFRHMQLADASVIIFSTPVFVAIFAKCFLKEPCGCFNVITIGLTLCGIVLITRPKVIFGETGSTKDDNIEYNLFGPVAAFASTLFGANAYVLLRVRICNI